MARLTGDEISELRISFPTGASFSRSAPCPCSCGVGISLLPGLPTLWAEVGSSLAPVIAQRAPPAAIGLLRLVLSSLRHRLRGSCANDGVEAWQYLSIAIRLIPEHDIENR